MKVSLDIAGRKHRYALTFKGKLEEGELNNEPAALNRFFAHIAKRDPKAQVIMEATGVYHWDAAMAAHRAGLQVMVSNPKQTVNFAKVLNIRSKTDRVDARLLLQFLERMPFQPWQPPRRTVMELRVIARYLLTLTEQMTAMKNRLHAGETFADTPSFVLRDYRQEIKRLQKRIDTGTAEALQRVKLDADLKAQFDALDSITGIGATSAISALGELAAMPIEMNSKACVAHAGLDVRQFESGTSVNKPGRLSKQGNAYLRRAMYMPALVAVQHDPHARAHYLHLQAKGKKKMQALCAVMRKLLTAAWSLMKSRQQYDGEKLFAIPIEA